jgi:repressor LexA
MALRHRAAVAGRPDDLRLIDAALANDSRAALRARIGNVCLTARQWDVLRTIDRLTHAHGLPPTYREIGDVLGITAVVAFTHARGLLRRGIVAVDPHRSRSIRIVDRAAADRAAAAKVAATAKVAPTTNVAPTSAA